MKAIENRAIEAYRQFLDVWASRDSEDRETLQSILDPSISAFGTAGHEVFKDQAAFLGQYDKEVLQLPEGGSLDIKWVEAEEVTRNIVAVQSEFIGHFTISGKAVTIGPMRATGIFVENGSRMLLRQWHASVPDITSEEEVFPGSRKPKRYDEVSVLFTDFVGFAYAVSTMPAQRLVAELDEIFGIFDDIAAKFGVEKIKTIGDAYMAASGLKEHRNDHALNCVRAAKGMIEYLIRRNEKSALKWEIRAGIHSGPVVGGVIGKEKLSYDLWGDTVNLANRMESSGEGGKINVSAYTYELIHKEFPCTYRGKVQTKEGGKLDMYFVD